ncbi:MAG TPA: methionyl-tRNA formyltransferase, partial [Xanthomonadaceae bacterium]|nr:methionyl-tRNA formyltransferase [Xanthomonadaceae bacterium]
MKPLRLVFAGTPDFAVPALRALLEGPDTLLAVYTQPDRPAGRGRALTPSPVKQVALQAGIEVRQPVTLKTVEARAALAELGPDLMIVVAYGLILPRRVLAIPAHGCWNVHASLLPRWRGAAPIQRAIEAGDAKTGVCLMQMEAGLDTGPVLLSRATPIGDEETAGSLHDRLAAMGADLLREGLAALREGRLPAAQAQSEVGVTYARKLDKAEAALDPSRPATELAARVRAFLPWPVATVEVAGDRIRVLAGDRVSVELSPY